MEKETFFLQDKLISKHIYESDLIQIAKKHWDYNLDFENENIAIRTKPFKTCQIKNFLQNSLGTYALQGELRSVHTRKRGNDLMKLEESVCDLQDLTPAHSYSQNIDCIKQLCWELKRNFRQWLSDVTKLKLDDKLSIRTSTYTDTDFLLCHNDQIEDRKIAFILYLSKDWKIEYGGELNVFSSKDKLPDKIWDSILPEYNSLLFFEVSHQSYHSVSEILENTSRFSVNGWFHDASVITTQSEPLRLDEMDRFKAPIDDGNVDPSSFIVGTRLYDQLFLEIINMVIESISFCGIKNYFKEAQYKNLLKEIGSENIRWNNVGPPDQKNYDVAELISLPSNLRDFCHMFESTEFCRLLNKYTELQLEPNGSNNPKCTIELQRWYQGCYTVLHDGHVKNKEGEEEEPEDEEKDVEEEVRPVKERKKDGKRKSKSYNFKDMLRDIIVASNDITKVLSKLPKVLRDELNDDVEEPGPSGSRSNLDDLGPTSPKRIKKENEHDNENESEEGEGAKGILDVIMYFHASNAPDDTTLDYVDPGKEDGVFLTLPIEDNSLFIVYRQDGVVRHNEYVNHYCKGNFYSLVCSYSE